MYNFFQTYKLMFCSLSSDILQCYCSCVLLSDFRASLLWLLSSLLDYQWLYYLQIELALVFIKIQYMVLIIFCLLARKEIYMTAEILRDKTFYISNDYQHNCPFYRLISLTITSFEPINEKSINLSKIFQPTNNMTWL